LQPFRSDVAFHTEPADTVTVHLQPGLPDSVHDLLTTCGFTRTGERTYALAGAQAADRTSYAADLLAASGLVVAAHPPQGLATSRHHGPDAPLRCTDVTFQQHPRLGLIAAADPDPEHISHRVLRHLGFTLHEQAQVFVLGDGLAWQDGVRAAIRASEILTSLGLDVTASADVVSAAISSRLPPQAETTASAAGLTAHILHEALDDSTGPLRQLARMVANALAAAEANPSPDYNVTDALLHATDCLAMTRADLRQAAARTQRTVTASRSSGQTRPAPADRNMPGQAAAGPSGPARRRS